MSLRGKTVLLTGASGGIGTATAAALLEQGAHLVAHYATDRDAVERACASAPAGTWTPLHADLAQRGAGRLLWRQAVRLRGHVDVVVLNAAVSVETPVDGTDEQWDDGWERTLRVNLLEPVGLAREAVQHFLATGGGTMITVSSWAAQRGSAIPQLSSYAASKAALHNFAQTVARSHARDRISSFVLAPGIVRTPMSEIAATYRGGVDAVNAMLPMGEMVEPVEVARVITFLATGAAPNLTGAALDLNGAANIR
jgi:NAD(P)-dependent dehydrogenase (short-subunit alcohol dehydrogenase family)